jgi:hypothetical protein
MDILSPVKQEFLNVDEYIDFMSDGSLSDKVARTRYEINKDWSSPETGYFVVDYKHPILREKSI